MKIRPPEEATPGEAEADDVISIEAAIGKTSAVSFKLSNVFEADAAFIAYFTPESPAVFSVRPPAGILSSAGSDGQLFTVGYSPTEYGKALKNFTACDKHFTDIVEDQFDFHTYCIRKMTLRAYVRMLRTVGSNERGLVRPR